MVMTRAQERGETTTGPQPAKKNHKEPKIQRGVKHEAPPKEKPGNHKVAKVESETKPKKPLPDAVLKDIHRIVKEQGNLPFQDIGHKFPLASNSETVMALLFEAMLKGAPVSHVKAEQTLKVLIENGYTNFDTLKSSSWDDRENVLTEGGYRRYWQKMASQMDDLVDLASKKYDGDLSRLHTRIGAGKDVRSALEEIKGIGDVATDIFLSSVQSFWPEAAPFVAKRSLETAQHLGIGTDVEAMYDAMDRDPKRMCMLARALSKIRLEKEEKDYTLHGELGAQGGQPSGKE